MPGNDHSESPSSGKAAGSLLRSFRLSRPLAEALERGAESAGKSQNSLAQRYIDEGLRRDAHHFIDFRQGISQGAPIVSGTRIKVSHVVRAYKQSGDSVEDIADSLRLPVTGVQACLSYYAEFAEEIDREIADEDEYAERAHAGWLREQEVTRARPLPKGKKKAS